MYWCIGCNTFSAIHIMHYIKNTLRWSQHLGFMYNWICKQKYVFGNLCFEDKRRWSWVIIKRILLITILWWWFLWNFFSIYFSLTNSKYVYVCVWLSINCLTNQINFQEAIYGIQFLIHNVKSMTKNKKRMRLNESWLV